MGSTFISIDKITSEAKKLFGDTRPQPVYMQFVHGYVGEVITSSDSPNYMNNDRRINSIKAMPHIGENIKKSSTLDEDDRYYPLLRGIVDVPVVGDQVLLTTIGGIKYYLGPLNTANNPNWNIDPDYITHTESRPAESKGGYGEPKSERDRVGLSKDFKLMDLSRLQKYYHPELDPAGEGYANLHGDMVFEGRHGNSIRIGSRTVNPYIIISNGRNPSSAVEGTNDGSIIGMFEYGTVRQHFSTDLMPDPTGKYQYTKYNWKLASDERDLVGDTPNRLMANLVSLVNNEEADKLIYSYGNPALEPISNSTNQTFINSDRITINAKQESLFFSAFQDINIGSGKNITISSNGDVVIDAERTFLGVSQYSKPTQGLVMGENLRTVLEELVDALMGAEFQCQGAWLKLCHAGGIPGSMELKLNGIRNKLTKGTNKFVSKKHFIENN